MSLYSYILYKLNGIIMVRGKYFEYVIKFNSAQSKNISTFHTSSITHSCNYSKKFYSTEHMQESNNKENWLKEALKNTQKIIFGSKNNASSNISNHTKDLSRISEFKEETLKTANSNEELLDYPSKSALAMICDPDVSNINNEVPGYLKTTTLEQIHGKKGIDIMGETLDNNNTETKVAGEINTPSDN
ncbi:MAG: hypothetical protein K0R02_1224 [Rickettsiaceae bacterium]|jgi:hypothetical protein|nr:hypothetical protein [Rickettsiaceae bacterium]